MKGGFLVFLDGSSLNTDGKDLLEGKGDNIKGKLVKRYLRLAKKCTESSRKGEAGVQAEGQVDNGDTDTEGHSQKYK